MQQGNTSNINIGKAALWASAFVIAALVLVQVGNLPTNPAYAGSISNGANYTLLAVDSGRGEDADPDEILVVIDNRAETIIAYGLNVRTPALEPIDGGALPALFRRGLQR